MDSVIKRMISEYRQRDYHGEIYTDNLEEGIESELHVILDERITQSPLQDNPLKVDKDQKLRLKELEEELNSVSIEACYVDAKSVVEMKYRIGCTMCKKHFKTNNRLKIHRRKKHRKPKKTKKEKNLKGTSVRIECKICLKSFTSKGRWKKHIKKSHRPKPPHPPFICNKNIETNTEDTTPFKCHYCLKKHAAPSVAMKSVDHLIGFESYIVYMICYCTSFFNCAENFVILETNKYKVHMWSSYIKIQKKDPLAVAFPVCDRMFEKVKPNHVHELLNETFLDTLLCGRKFTLNVLENIIETLEKDLFLNVPGKKLKKWYNDIVIIALYSLYWLEIIKIREIVPKYDTLADNFEVFGDFMTALDAFDDMLKGKYEALYCHCDNIEVLGKYEEILSIYPLKKGKIFFLKNLFIQFFRHISGLWFHYDYERTCLIYAYDRMVEDINTYLAN